MMNGTEMMDCMNAMGMMGLPMGLTVGLFWILILGLVVWGLYRLFTTSTPALGSEETPLDALQRRYAEGEISTDEYQERKDVLRS